MNNSGNIIEFSEADRKFYDGRIRLGKKLGILTMNLQLKHHITIRGMSRINLIAEWDNIVGKIYAEHSMPDRIKKISGLKTLICKVRYTRIIEFQHQKSEFIKQINLFAGTSLIDDIQFLRVDNLPKKQKRTIPVGLKIPNVPHQKLSELPSQCHNIELQKAFHLLAHLIIPNNKTITDLNNTVIPQKNQNLLNSWREKAKIILNCSNK